MAERAAKSLRGGGGKGAAAKGKGKAAGQKKGGADDEREETLQAVVRLRDSLTKLR